MNVSCFLSFAWVPNGGGWAVMDTRQYHVSLVPYHADGQGKVPNKEPCNKDLAIRATLELPPSPL